MPCCLLQAMYSVHVYMCTMYKGPAGWLARRQGAGYGSDSQSLLPTHAMQPHLRPYLATTSTSFKWALREALPAIVSSTTCTSAASPVLLSLETDHGIMASLDSGKEPHGLNHPCSLLLSDSLTRCLSHYPYLPLARLYIVSL